LTKEDTFSISTDVGPVKPPITLQKEIEVKLPEKGSEKRERRLRLSASLNKTDAPGKKKVRTPTKQPRLLSNNNKYSPRPIKNGTANPEISTEVKLDLSNENLVLVTPQKAKNEGSSQSHSTEETPTKTLNVSFPSGKTKKTKVKDSGSSPSTSRIAKPRKKGIGSKVLAATPSPRRWPLSPKPEIAQRRVQIQRNCKSQTLLKKKRSFDFRDEDTPKKKRKLNSVNPYIVPVSEIKQEPSNVCVLDLDVGTESTQPSSVALNWESRLSVDKMV